MNPSNLDRELATTQTLLEKTIAADKILCEQIYLTRQRIKNNYNSRQFLTDRLEQNAFAIERNTAIIERNIQAMQTIYKQVAQLEVKLARLDRSQPPDR
jgi:hypothetical protein